MAKIPGGGSRRFTTIEGTRAPSREFSKLPEVRQRTALPPFARGFYVGALMGVAIASAVFGLAGAVL